MDNLPELLNRCGKIYMPVREDSMAVTKIAQYEKVMVAREYEEVLGKTIKLKLPFHSSFGKKEHYVEQLISSPFSALSIKSSTVRCLSSSAL